MPELITAGMWFPPGGWAAPAVPVGIPGVEVWPGPDGAMRYYVQVGTQAWDMYQASLVAPSESTRSDVNLLPGPWNGQTFVEVDPAGPFPLPIDSVNQSTNDPSLGVVPIGIPTDQSRPAKLFRAPAILLSRLMPAGPVSDLTAILMAGLPWVFWGGLAWWIFRRLRK